MTLHQHLLNELLRPLVKMLSAVALVLLAFGVSDGRIVSKCELKEQLEAAQIRVIKDPGDKTFPDKLIARLVCNVGYTSGFNTSLVTSVQINQDEIRPPIQIPPRPQPENHPAKEEDDEKMEHEHMIPVRPLNRPKGRQGRSVPESKKDLFWTWHRSLFQEKIPVDSSGSGSEAASEEDSSGDSSEENLFTWNALGIFQLSDRVACVSGSSRSLNLCGLKCSALTDDDITDDIVCLKTLVGSNSKIVGLTGKKRLLANMLAAKECRSVVPSKYFAECT